MKTVSFSGNQVIFREGDLAETMYEIYSDKGALMDKGVGVKADVSKLPAGDYFLNYDTKTEMFKKK